MSNYVNLGDIMDGITAYDDVFKQFNYTKTGEGVRAWSTRMTGADGSTIDFRATEWVYEGTRGTHIGHNAKDLKAFLLETLTREDLIALITGSSK